MSLLISVVDRGLAQDQVDLVRAWSCGRVTAAVKVGIRVHRHLWKIPEGTTPDHGARPVNVMAGLQQVLGRLAGIC